MPHLPWLGAGLDWASSICHPIAEAFRSGCTQRRAAFFPEKPGPVLPETGCRHSTGEEVCVSVCVCECVCVCVSVCVCVCVVVL